MRASFTRLLAFLAVLALVAAACGSGETDQAAGGDDSTSSTETTETTDGESSETTADGDEGDDASPVERPTIAVTTNILGDVVTELVSDQADVLIIMPVGADPHDFQASAQEIAMVLEADALITNGASFEEGLLDVIGSAEAEGVPVHGAIETVTTIEYGEGGHDDHGDEDAHDDHGDEDHDDEDKEHSDEDHDDHGDEDGHDHSGDDPHFFTDPVRMADAAEGISAFLIEAVPALDSDLLDASTADYVGQLNDLDAEVRALVDAIPDDQRVLITNHEVFGYFADQYGFEVVGAVIPSGSTADGTSAGDLAELAETIQAEGVPAIFSDFSASAELVETLAAEVGDVEVVELFSESLGEAGSGGETYLEMIRTNATRIGTALS